MENYEQPLSPEGGLATEKRAKADKEVARELTGKFNRADIDVRKGSEYSLGGKTLEVKSDKDIALARLQFKQTLAHEQAEAAAEANNYYEEQAARKVEEALGVEANLLIRWFELEEDYPESRKLLGD